MKVHPDEPSSEVVQVMDTSLDGISFAPGGRTLLFNSEDGRIWRMPVDASGQAGEPELFVDVEPDDKLDGMHHDVCGNRFVVDLGGGLFEMEVGIPGASVSADPPCAP